MLGFKSFSSAAVTLAGIEMVHMMRKRQGRFTYNSAPSLKEQFEASRLKSVWIQPRLWLAEYLQQNQLKLPLRALTTIQALRFHYWRPPSGVCRAVTN